MAGACEAKHGIAMKTALSLLLLLAAATSAQTRPSSRPGGDITPPPRRDVPGKRFQLKSGELFIADFFHATGRVDLVIWFLGAPWCTEQVFYDAHRNAVLLVANPRTLARGFEKVGDFSDLLEEISGALNHQGVTDQGVGQVALVSFSGGWIAVRDVLSHADFAAAVSDVVLLDSLYARNEKSLAPFVEFARRAAENQVTFVFTQLYPPLEEHRGNTTTACAMKLIEQCQLVRGAGSGGESAQRKLLYRADRGKAHVLGYSGMTNQDHFEHLYDAAPALRMMSIPAAP
jgi:hypothetical protein